MIELEKMAMRRSAEQIIMQKICSELMKFKFGAARIATVNSCVLLEESASKS